MKGWVYVISNKAMLGIVKVGYTLKDPALRADGLLLNSTGAPFPYVVEYEILVEGPYQIEQKTHNLLAAKREGKEWFRCSAEEAVVAIKKVVKESFITEIYHKADREKAEQIRTHEREKREFSLQVYKLIENGIDINVRSKGNYTYLMMACCFGYLDIVRLLIENGADIELKGPHGYNALMIATSGGYYDIVEFLLNSGADLNTVEDSGWTVLMKASFKGYLDIVKLLIEIGADINKGNNVGLMPIVAASINGHVDVVKELIIQGADIEEQGNSALLLASKNGHAHVVRELIINGVDVNAETYYGSTALMLSSENGHIEVVRELLKSDDLNTEDDNFHLALALADADKHDEIVQELLNKLTAATQLLLWPELPGDLKTEPPEPKQYNQKAAMSKIINFEDRLRSKEHAQELSAETKPLGQLATRPGTVVKRMQFVVNTPDGEVPLLEFLKRLPPGTKIKFGDTEGIIQ